MVTAHLIYFPVASLVQQPDVWNVLVILHYRLPSAPSNHQYYHHMITQESHNHLPDCSDHVM